MTDDGTSQVGGDARTADADVAFRPRATRYTTILLVARMLHGEREDLCRVRNVSTGGMMVETYAPLSEGDRIRVELRNLQTADAIVAWTKDDRAGCQFVDPVVVQSFLAPPAKGGLTPRSPRVAAGCPVELRRAGKTLHATLVDVSQSGCRLRLSGGLVVDDRIYVNIPKLDPRRAVVRWGTDGSFGIGFVDTIAFPELCGWLHDETLRFAARLGQDRSPA